MGMVEVLGRFCRKLVYLAGIITAMAAFNEWVYRVAQSRRSRISRNTFDWKYGKISYYTQGEGKPLLLIHGIGAGASSAEFNALIDSLSDDYKVYAIDLIGFGHSEKPHLSYTAYLYVTLINDFIRNVIGEKTYVIASNTSAMFTIRANALNPQQFDKMLLIAPTGIGSAVRHPNHKSRCIMAMFGLPILGMFMYNIITSRAYTRRFLREHAFVEPRYVTSKMIEGYYDSAKSGGCDARWPLAAFMADYLSGDVEHMLAGLGDKARLIWGADNRLNPVTNAHKAQHLNPNLTLSVYDNTRLLPHVESADIFLRECKEYFI